MIGPRGGGEHGPCRKVSWNLSRKYRGKRDSGPVWRPVVSHPLVQTPHVLGEYPAISLYIVAIDGHPLNPKFMLTRRNCKASVCLFPVPGQCCVEFLAL